MNRRIFIQSSAVSLLASQFLLSGCDGEYIKSAANDDSAENFADALNALTMNNGGRLGVAIIAGDAVIQSHADQRFAMCSTFKLPLAAMILREIDLGHINADERITIKQSDILGHAPVTKEHLDTGYMSVLALAEAAQKTSDNTAANLLLSRIGGPAAFTQNMRDMGDQMTRLDRIEPRMNLVPAGEVQDTTTPLAMAQSLHYIFERDYLRAESRAILKQWMIDTKTGLKRVRAGLPEHWIAGDKTGTGIAPSMANKHNDIGIIWPPTGKPIYFAAYYEADAHYDNMRPQDDAILAEAGKIIHKTV